ncbi:MAG: 2-hydroxyglutaryl-CoA dehydratase, D-component [candidate division BRC1 bacterium ADurb.BinA364]|nr:MAG: 2-hydroxyglutaryl-CoA dehydratase, D-component [candidate division BRC1 bacterium ADurb.BinA364]
MKDLGTVPVMAFSAPNLAAFYPDGAWWIPCVMELSAGLLEIADSLGVDESFCPVRAMLGAFLTEAHFPIPDLLVCSAGAVCDDFSAIAQRLDGLGYPIFWWEIPARRPPERGERSVALPGGLSAPASQVEFVRGELERVRRVLEDLSGEALADAELAEGIRQANRVRRALGALRGLVYGADPCPLPALEMQIAEMLAIHFCSDRAEALNVLKGLLAETQNRRRRRWGTAAPGAARVYWLNPVADLRMMNALEDCGARLSGAEYLFSHAIDAIPEDLEPLEALARTALADPMIGPAADRAKRIVAEMRRFGAEALIVSRIPGASHCATEGEAIRQIVDAELGVPTLELETPVLMDSARSGLIDRMQALVETILARRRAASEAPHAQP